MGFFDEMKSWTKTQAISLTEGVKKVKNKKFMEATVAGCAMVAFADGTIKPEEKAKMGGFIQRDDALNVFDMSDVIATFEKFVQGFEFDAHIGKAEALKAIAKIKNPEEAKLLVRVCCAVGTADGDFSEAEKRMVGEICRELGLTPADFDLQPSQPTPPTPPGASTPPTPPAASGTKDDGVPEWMQTGRR